MPEVESEVLPNLAPLPREGLARLWRRLQPLRRGCTKQATDGGIAAACHQPLAFDHLRLATPVREAIHRAQAATSPGLVFSRGRLGVIIPVRNREHHLAELLPTLCRTLDEAAIEYEIHVIEQTHGLPFNKGQLFNAGIREALERCDYIALHDVDFLPVKVCYARPNRPLRPFGICLNNYGTRPLPNPCFGGVVIAPGRDLLRINGLSNRYWHWGKEDDDLLLRCLLAGVVPYVDHSGLFRELEHSSSRGQTPEGKPPGSIMEKRALRRLYQRNRSRFRLMARGLLEPSADGLSDLPCRILGRQHESTFTRIVLEPGGQP